MNTKKPRTYKLNKQQERLFTSAGFTAMRRADGSLEGNPFDLCYWKRGDIRIATTATRPYTVLEFTNAVIAQTYYRTVRFVQESMNRSVSAKEIGLDVSPTIK